MSNAEQKKQAVAQAAIEFIEYDDIVGVGTGSTVDYFIEYLKPLKNKISGAVASSISTQKKLEANGIRVLDLNDVSEIPIYIDGADEVNSNLQLIKGGGGALTREKIIAGASKKFICIVDESKVVDILGSFPLPLEVLPFS